jgi:hypothetical protein
MSTGLRSAQGRVKIEFAAGGLDRPVHYPI